MLTFLVKAGSIKRAQKTLGIVGRGKTMKQVKRESLKGRSVLLASLAILLSSQSVSAMAMSSLRPSELVSQKRTPANVASVAPKVTMSQDLRSPLIMSIGNRQHLFDGAFLCELSDHSPVLGRVR